MPTLRKAPKNLVEASWLDDSATLSHQNLGWALSRQGDRTRVVIKGQVAASYYVLTLFCLAAGYQYAHNVQARHLPPADMWARPRASRPRQPWQAVAGNTKQLHTPKDQG
jgi:hypothetical protein